MIFYKSIVVLFIVCQAYYLFQSLYIVFIKNKPGKAAKIAKAKPAKIEPEELSHVKDAIATLRKLGYTAKRSREAMERVENKREKNVTQLVREALNVLNK